MSAVEAYCSEPNENFRNDLSFKRVAQFENIIDKIFYIILKKNEIPTDLNRLLEVNNSYDKYPKVKFLKNVVKLYNTFKKVKNFE
jgi:hypothetical protein